METNNFRNNYSQKGCSNERRGNNNQPETPEAVFQKANFQSKWITDQADKDLVIFAETMGKYMANNGLTNSKIRSIFGEIKRIQMGEFDKEKSSFYLLKPKVAYALGREKTNKGLQLFKLLFDKSSEYVNSQKCYLNFCNLVEAVLAYHKAYGGKD